MLRSSLKLLSSTSMVMTLKHVFALRTSPLNIDKHLTKMSSSTWSATDVAATTKVTNQASLSHLCTSSSMPSAQLVPCIPKRLSVVEISLQLRLKRLKLSTRVNSSRYLHPLLITKKSTIQTLWLLLFLMQKMFLHLSQKNSSAKLQRHRLQSLKDSMYIPSCCHNFKSVLSQSTTALSTGQPVKCLPSVPFLRKDDQFVWPDKIHVVEHSQTAML
ncbi:unannotated protein [freshwater metagenome]|uniref:Unannotated protein n=1 Tax=freshwater metagenome TaxID=449393 RepID=A0A6J7TTS5_9ZZZZ